MIVSALLVLAAVQAVRAQTTVSLMPVGFEGDGLQGEAIGTGAGGTTYRLSATFGDAGLPYTMTLVQDATHVSFAVDLATLGINVPVSVQCSWASTGDAVCREAIGTGTGATSFTETGPVLLTGVPLGVTGPRTVTASGTDDVLPPSITVPTTTGTTASLITTDAFGPEPTDPDGIQLSSAMKTLGTIMLDCVAVPAFLAFLCTLL